MDEQTREAHRRIFEKSLTAFPAPVADKARAEFPGSADCYRLKDDPGHYFLIAFAPPGSFPEYVTPYDDSLTAVVMHGTDSTSPGEIVVKVPFQHIRQIPRCHLPSVQHATSIDGRCPNSLS